jgi:hypothetical protein
LTYDLEQKKLLINLWGKWYDVLGNDANMKWYHFHTWIFIVPSRYYFFLFTFYDSTLQIYWKNKSKCIKILVVNLNTKISICFAINILQYIYWISQNHIHWFISCEKFRFF